jgi:hypothetical protein
MSLCTNERAARGYSDFSVEAGERRVGLDEVSEAPALRGRTPLVAVDIVLVVEGIRASGSKWQASYPVKVIPCKRNRESLGTAIAEAGCKSAIHPLSLLFHEQNNHRGLKSSGSASAFPPPCPRSRPQDRRSHQISVWHLPFCPRTFLVFIFFFLVSIGGVS